jgi:hypothetical protein
MPVSGRHPNPETQMTTWRHDLDAALADARTSKGRTEQAVLLDFSAAPM